MSFYFLFVYIVFVFYKHIVKFYKHRLEHIKKKKIQMPLNI